MSSTTKGQRSTVSQSVVITTSILSETADCNTTPHISQTLFGHLFRLKFKRLGFACLCEKHCSKGFITSSICGCYGVGRNSDGSVSTPYLSTLRIKIELWMSHVISKRARSSSMIYLTTLYITSDQYCVFVVSVTHIMELSLTEKWWWQYRSMKGYLFVIK